MLFGQARILSRAVARFSLALLILPRLALVAAAEAPPPQLWVQVLTEASPGTDAFVVLDDGENPQATINAFGAVGLVVFDKDGNRVRFSRHGISPPVAFQLDNRTGKIRGRYAGTWE